MNLGIFRDANMAEMRTRLQDAAEPATSKKGNWLLLAADCPAFKSYPHEAEESLSYPKTEGKKNPK